MAYYAHPRIQSRTEMHPYETPEIIATTIDQASEAYEVWVRGEVSGQ
jgi:uncharacterized protein involved in tolerance to divalent cations